MIRLDKYFSGQGVLSRTLVAEAIKRKRIAVNGVTATRKDVKIDENKDVITLDGNHIAYKKYVYVMLNKPLGVVSATEDGKDKTVIDILPDELQKTGLFPSGRLDKETSGLIILTNDGVSSHKRLSPKNHVEKVYEYECIEELSDEDKQKIEQGITLKDGYTTKPCMIEKTDGYSGKITLTEGKYHEIRRLFGAVGNKITSLKRVSFGSILLDDKLESGEWRYLTKDEIKEFTK